jgi:membrane-associated phospholipid phosphatase
MGISPLMVLLIGLSRVYVGGHWATDVVGGWLSGGAWLLVLVAAHRWWVFRRAKS